KAAGIAVEHAPASVSAALHPDLVPQPGRAQIAAGHKMGPVRSNARAIEIGALANVVDLGRHDEAFRTGSFVDAPPRSLCGRARQRSEKIGELRLELRPMIGLRGDVAEPGSAIEERRADA